MGTDAANVQRRQLGGGLNRDMLPAEPFQWWLAANRDLLHGTGTQR
jgi:hypothetical protein